MGEKGIQIATIGHVDNHRMATCGTCGTDDWYCVEFSFPFDEGVICEYAMLFHDSRNHIDYTTGRLDKPRLWRRLLRRVFFWVPFVFNLVLYVWLVLNLRMVGKEHEDTENSRRWHLP